jgi:hypothetical protein
MRSRQRTAAFACWPHPVGAQQIAASHIGVGGVAPRHDVSAVDGGHVRLVVALAGGRGEIVEPLDLFRAQLDAVGSGVLLDARDALGAGDRGDVIALCEQPGQGDLRR